MISYPEALEIIRQAVTPLRESERELAELVACVSAGQVTSRLDVPGFVNSAMDGFAVRARDTEGASDQSPLILPVVATLAAGDAPSESTINEGAVEIMTGAPVPPDYDAVIPVEHVTTATNSVGSIQSIRVTAPATPGQNIRGTGEDFRSGEEILGAGQATEPHVVMGLAATGTDRVAVHPPPRIALITTGSELTASGTPSRLGLIRDSNGPYLVTMARQLGAILTARESVADDVRDLGNRLQRCAADSDVVLTTGGVSAGRFDMVPDTITDLGGEILFHKVAIRPGKPILFARLPDKTLIFSLPGNPIAVAVGLRFFVVPALRQLQSLPPEELHSARSQGRIRKREDQRFFGKARARVNDDARLEVQLLPGQESFKIAPLMAANCWAIVPEGRDSVAPGELIEVAPLYPTGFLQ